MQLTDKEKVKVYEHSMKFNRKIFYEKTDIAIAVV